jgi:hypothetical protein
MKLEDVLAKKRATIVKKWFDHVVDTYPTDTSRFLKSQKDPFANPVGNTTREGLGALFADLQAETLDTAAAADHLDPIIRIRAVQHFSPGRATGFVFAIKSIVRGHLGGLGADRELADALAAFDGRVDQLCLIAFDCYMKCREKIYQIQASEQRNRFFKAFERAGLVTEIENGGPGSGKSDLTQ